MPPEQSKPEGLTRRELFERLARMAGLVAVTGGSGELIRRTLCNGGKPTLSLCDRCGVFEDCRLPEARAQRRKGLGLVTPVRRRGDGDVAAEQPLCEDGKARRAEAAEHKTEA